jgi:isorenieratene synthase
VLSVDNPDHWDVIIIGAGLAGLTAALHLVERGIRPLILEADPTFPGGRLKGGETVRIGDWSFRMEHGVHGIWSQYRNLQAMLTRRRIRPMWISAREERWIFKFGERINHANVGSAIRRSPIPAPFHYLNLFFRPGFLSMLGLADLISLFQVWSGLLYALGIDPLREGQPLAGKSLSDILKHWPPALRAFFIGLTRSGLAARPEEIPLAGYIAFLRFYTVLRRDAWSFSYFPSNSGTSLIDPLVHDLQNMGAEIRLGHHVTSLEQIDEQYSIHCHLDNDSPKVYTAKWIILAVDAPAAQNILTASPSTTALLANNLEWPCGQENAIIRVWFDREPHPGPEAGIFSGGFILDNYFWLDQILEEYIRWRRASGGSAVEAHIYGPPDLLAESDALLLSRSINDIQAAFPELRGHRIHQVIQRNPPTHTLFTVLSPERHLGIRTPWTGLYCCGDWVRHPAPCLFLERAVLTGIEAANAILADSDLPGWPLLDYSPPEPFAGWIEKLMVRGRANRRVRTKGKNHV